MSAATPLRMSVLGGLWRLRNLSASRPDINPLEAARLLANGRAIDSAYDYPASLEVCSLLSLELRALPLERVELLRHIIRLSLLTLQPRYALALPYGRTQVYRLLSEDERQCFEAAQLMQQNPSPEVIAWWDDLALSQRSGRSADNLETGRRAEELSLTRERLRLAHAGRPDLTPVLVAIDDNTLGYDIRSFEPDGSPRYIEVKGCSGVPLIFFLSRNEWRPAIGLKNQFEVHVWNLSSTELHVLSFAELSRHIPCDQGDGRWQEVKVARAP